MENSDILSTLLTQYKLQIAEQNCHKLPNKMLTFLMVLVASGKYAYRREDGVYVVPIGCLKN